MILDNYDKKICFYLNQNGRLSLSILSEHVGLSREAINARMKKLQKNKVILSFTTAYSHPYFGLNFFDLYVSFVRLDATKQKNFDKYVRNHKSVLWANRCLGKWDYALFLIIKDSKDLSDLLEEFKEKFKGFIKDFDFDEVLYEFTYQAGVPAFFKDLEIKPIKLKKEDSSFFNILSTKLAAIEKDHKKVSIDKTDTLIMQCLSENCRVSLEEMSAKIGIPPENIRYHMKKLIQEDVIAAFWAPINYDLFGLNWYRVRLRLNKASEEENQKLKKFFLNHPNVFWATRTLGKTDAHIDVRVNGNNELNDFLAGFNKEFDGLIIDYDTIIMTQEQTHNNFTEKIFEVAK